MIINIAALLCGLVFGLGLILSGMGNPAKVQNFLDFSVDGILRWASSWAEPSP